VTATPWLRFAAGCVDATLAVALGILAVRVIDHGRLSDVALHAQTRAALAGLFFFALRDVASGASLAKWLMGVRVETAAGRRPSIASRLARAPWSILPFGMIPAIERLTPWRVTAYAPSTTGLTVRAALAAAALAATATWTFAATRPSIGRNDALRLARSLVAGDSLLRDRLGEPCEVEVDELVPRARLGWSRGEGVFAVHVRGARAQQTMTVRSRRIAGVWAVDEVTDIEVSPTVASKSVAAR